MKGEFIRNESRFRNWVTAGEDSERGSQDIFPAEPGRYPMPVPGPTLVRFDAVYYTHFKCNRHHVS